MRDAGNSREYDDILRNIEEAAYRLQPVDGEGMRDVLLELIRAVKRSNELDFDTEAKVPENISIDAALRQLIADSDFDEVKTILDMIGEKQ